jgi:hypothetical protein
MLTEEMSGVKEEVAEGVAMCEAASLKIHMAH